MTKSQQKPRKPWDAFPRSDAEPSTEPELHQAIGAACSAWASVEHQLFMVFREVFMPQRALSAWKMYAAFPTSSGKINYIKAAVEGAFKADECAVKALFDVLDNLVAKFAPRRNDIAHGMVFKTDNGLFILAEPIHRMKDFENLGYVYGAKQIRDYAEQFNLLSAETAITKILMFSETRLPPTSWPDTPLTQYVQRTRDALRKR